MRAVLDTNVIISAFLTPDGTEALILELFKQRRSDLIVSPALIEELERVIGYPKIERLARLLPQQQEVLLAELRDFTISVAGDSPVDVCRDSNDNKFLAAALEGDADYLVSGDKDLLVLGHYKSIRIVRPAEFAAILSRRN